MSEPAWLMKMQAREALKAGRPEDAHRLLDGLIAAGNRRAWALRADVIRGYIDRGDQHIARHDTDRAWRDFLLADSITPGDKTARKLRDRIVEHGLKSVRELLDNGQPLHVLPEIASLRERGIAADELTRLESCAREWALAEDHAQNGEFVLARQALDQCRKYCEPPPAGLERFEREMARREERFRGAIEKLHESDRSASAHAMFRHAEDALAAAPRHRAAQTLRSRAWQALQPETAAYRNDPTPFDGIPAYAVPVEPAAPLKRFFLWIDNVGGFLVCLGNQVTIGQASAESGPIDIPLMADVSRFHATLKRDDDAYILESGQTLLVNDRPLDRASVLQSGDTLGLNASCAMRFTLPVPGCASARLDFPGTRRLPMAVDAVLLMADMLVLGPGDKVHVSMPELEKPLRIFRQKDRLGLQCEGDFHIAGEKQNGRALLPPQGSVHGPHFTMAIEPVKGR